MRFILPVVFVIAAVLMFFSVIEPWYGNVVELRREEKRFDDALSRARDLQEVRDRLIAKRNSFDPEDLDRLFTLLPDEVEDIRLILNIDTIAKNHNMEISELSVTRQAAASSDSNSESQNAVSPEATNAGVVDTTPYDSLVIAFGTDGTYTSFLAFLADLERSLGLVDVTELGITRGEEGSNSFDYKVSLRTYWLK